MSKYKTGDIIVLLPGIMGSVLRKGRKDVWGTSASAMMKAIVSRGESIQSIRLEGDDPTLDDLGDGIAAPRTIDSLTLIPGIAKVDGYERIGRELRDAFGLRDGRNYFEFAYDWRRDNAVAARKLQRESHVWLKRWRAESGNDEAKLILVAHSMGGLVSRHFLEVLGGWTETRLLVTFGTPYAGSVDALQYLVNGFRKIFDLSEVMRSFTSVYQLLPIYECVDIGSDDLVPIAKVPALPMLDNNRVIAARAFHELIASSQKTNASLTAYEMGYRTTPIVGIEQPTRQSVRFRNGVMEALYEFRGKDASGDGTVPRVSAVPTELVRAGREIYAVDKHASLQNNDSVLVNVRGVLSAPDVMQPKLRAAPPITLSLWLEDAYATSESVAVQVRPSSGRPRLKARLQRLGGKHRPKQVLLSTDGKGNQAVDFGRLSAGFYRLSIAGEKEKVAPATDIFMVA